MENKVYLTPIQTKILSLLYNMPNNDGMRRNEICRKLGFDGDKQRTTTYDNLDKLQRWGLIDKVSRNMNTGRGRPPVFWYMTKKGRRVKKRQIHASFL